MANAPIEIDARDLIKLEKKMELFPREATRAMVSATNRALSKIITYTAQEVKKEYPSIIRKDIKDIADIKRATYSDMNAGVTFTGRRLKASKFPNRISRSKNRSPVTLRIKGSVKSGDNPVMFGEGIGGSRGAGGKREIFKRTGNEVKTVYTLSIPQMISNEKVYNEIMERVEDEFLERFEHEYKYRISKL